MTHSLWQHLTGITVSPAAWGRNSGLWRLVGLLRQWYPGSWLLQWGTEISVALLTLLVALAPFVPNGLIGLIAAACGGVWGLLTLSDQTPRASRLTPIHILVLLYWGIAIAATALSPVKMAAATGLVKLTLYLSVFALLERVVRSPRWRSWLVTVYLHTALIVTVYGLRQWFFGAEALATWVDPESSLANTTRVYSYLGNPNLLAAYLIPAVPFSVAALFAWQHWGPKLLAALMVVTNMACLVLTFSRGGWIGLVVALFVMAMGLLYWLLPRLPNFWQVWAFPLVLGGLVGLGVLGVVTVAPLRERVFSIFADSKDSSNNFRLNVWASVQDMIRARPWLGIGPGNNAFNQIYPFYQRANYSALSAYSIYLELWVEVGVIGLSNFGWMLLVLFRQGWEQLQRLRAQDSREIFWLMAAIAIVCGMLAHGVVDTVWYRPEIATLWWLMVAIITSYYVPPLPNSVMKSPDS